jgi:hypothetical protein
LTDGTNDNLIIPLQYNLAESYTLIERNELYADCTIMVINSVKRTKDPWYTSSFFQFIIMVVMVVIIAYSGQAWIAGLLAAGTATATILYLMVTVLISIAAQYAFRRIIELYGEKIGIIGAIVLTVAAMLLTQGRSGFTMFNITLTYSQMMLQAAMVLISETNEFLIEEAREPVNAYAHFSARLADKYAELETVEEDLLGFNADLNPLLFASGRMRTVPNENFEMLRQRTIELPDNSAWIIHDEIPGFIDRTLRLDYKLPPDAYLT